MPERHLGIIEHYYPKAHAAILDLQDGDIHVGDEIHVQGKDVDFTETVKHLEMDHERVEEAHRGDKVGLEVAERVKANVDVYLVEG